jgi:hypothetical protein
VILEGKALCSERQECQFVRRASDCRCREGEHFGRDIDADHLIDCGIVVGKVAAGTETDFEHPAFGATDYA